MKVQQSSSFILPILGLDIAWLYKIGLSNTYMGSNHFSGEQNVWGEYFFLEFHNDKLGESDISKLRACPYYISEYDPNDYITHIVFNIPQEYKEGVVKPFLEGKFSKIDRNYVNTFHGPTIRNGKQEIGYNYKILTKHHEPRSYWEMRLGMSLPPDAEVWPRPEPSDEIYMYVQDTTIGDNGLSRGTVEESSSIQDA